MSVPGLALGVWDSSYQTLTAIDAEILRLLVLGTKKPTVISDTITISANSTTGEKTVWSSEDQLVIKKLEFTVPSGLTVTKVTLDIDGTVVEITFANTIDLEEVFGSKVYGNTIKIKLTVETAPSSDQNVDVKIYGFNAGKTQIPGG